VRNRGFQWLEQHERLSIGLVQRFFVRDRFSFFVFQFGNEGVFRLDEQEMARGKQYGAAGVARPLPGGHDRRAARQLLAKRFRALGKPAYIEFFQGLEMAEHVHRLGAQALCLAGRGAGERRFQGLENAVHPVWLIRQAEHFAGLERIGIVLLVHRVPGKQVGSEGGKVAMPFNKSLLRGIQVGEDEQPVVARGIGAQDCGGIVVVAGDHFDPGAGVEGGVCFHDGVDAAQPVDHIGFRAPVEGVGVVHVDLLLGKPLDAVGEAERTVMRGERAERGAEAGEGMRGGGEPGVVVGFAEVDQVAFGFRHPDAFGQIAVDLPLVVVLEDFGIGPVHAGIGEQAFGHVLVAAKPFEHENGVGIFHAHLGNDVFPCREGHLVAGVAAEPVDAPAAPEEEDIGHVVPKTARVVVQFRKVFPQHAPGPRRHERAVVVVVEPFGMVDLQVRCPAGVVDRHVEVDARIAPVHFVDEFLELVERRGLLVELGEGGIDIEQIHYGKGAAEAPHAGVGGRGGVDRQQLHDLAAQGADNKVEFLDEVAERSGLWKHGIARFVELPDGVFLVGGDGPAEFCLAELADKGGVHRVAGAGFGGLDLHDGVAAIGPQDFIGAIGDEIGFGLETADTEQGQGDGKPVPACGFHREIVPVARKRGEPLFRVQDDFCMADMSMANVRAQPGLAGLPGQVFEAKGDGVAAEMDRVFARCRGLNQIAH
jgi:hypothetical protein